MDDVNITFLNNDKNNKNMKIANLKKTMQIYLTIF